MAKGSSNNEFKFKMTEWRGYVKNEMEHARQDRKRLFKRLDKLVEQELITSERLIEAITTHTKTCPARDAVSSNPTPRFISKDNVKYVGAFIGIITTLSGVISTLVLIMARSLGVI